MILRKHILDLMTKMKTVWDQDSLQYLSSIPEKLTELEHDHLLSLSGNSCEVTEEGRAFLRNICMAFDARLTRKAPETRLFSQTV